MESMSIDQIKKIIRQELPAIIQEDIEMRRFVIHIAQSRFADKKETESRFDQVLNELRLDREEQRKKWDEQNRKWDEQNRTLDEQNRKWEENQQSIRKLFQLYDSGIGALGARWGIQTERAFRNGLKGILEDSFGVKVLNITEYDDEGEVFGCPDQVEIDVIIKNGVLILCEIKSSISRGDVSTFNRKIHFYEKLHNRIANRKIIISPMVDKYAHGMAEKMKMEIYSGSHDVVL